MLEDLLEYVHGAGLPALARYLSAMRVSVLAAGGLTGEAERSWRDAGLPGEAEQCLDRKTQTWREMEAVACARLNQAVNAFKCHLPDTSPPARTTRSS